MSSVTIYHFWKNDCPPCKQMKPVFEELHEEYPQIPWVSINVERDTDGIAQRLGVTRVPTLVTVATDILGTEVHKETSSGINVAAYYRIVRNLLRFI